MHTENHRQIGGRVDPDALDKRVAKPHRDMARGAGATPAHPLSATFGYPPNCAHGMNSFTDPGYDVALARLRLG